MRTRYKRTRHFIHPSSQLKYIALSILPAIIIGIFCTIVLVKSNELFVGIDEEIIFAELSQMRETVRALEKETYAANMTGKLRTMKDQLRSLESTLRMTYSDEPGEQDETLSVAFVGLLCVLACTGLISLFHSHRVAGPILRMKKCMDMLCEGKKIPPIRVRKHDEFKEVAESLNNLRNVLNNLGSERLESSLRLT